MTDKEIHKQHDTSKKPVVSADDWRKLDRVRKKLGDRYAIKDVEDMEAEIDGIQGTEPAPVHETRSSKPEKVRSSRLRRAIGAALLAVTAIVAFDSLREGSETDSKEAPTDTTYEVQAGDNPWSIAEGHLGESRDDHEIRDVVDGIHKQTEDGVLQPGDELRLPESK